MRKEGEWIASLGADLKVTRVDVAANEVLDLVEVTDVDRITERPSSVRFFDRVEARRLGEQLSRALEVLDPPRYIVGFASGSAGRKSVVIDRETDQPANPIKVYETEDEAQAAADELNRATDPKRQPLAGP